MDELKRIKIKITSTGSTYVRNVFPNQLRVTIPERYIQMVIYRTSIQIQFMCSDISLLVNSIKHVIFVLCFYILQEHIPPARSRWPNGKASDYGSEDSGFESRAGLTAFFCFCQGLFLCGQNSKNYLRTIRGIITKEESVIEEDDFGDKTTQYNTQAHVNIMFK